jgi:hypothetical protein
MGVATLRKEEDVMWNAPSLGEALAWPFLLPGNLVCNALGLPRTDYGQLVHMLVNSLAWTIVGIGIVAVVV